MQSYTISLEYKRKELHKPLPKSLIRGKGHFDIVYRKTPPTSKRRLQA
jgi:hypothetical protein